MPAGKRSPSSSPSSSASSQPAGGRSARGAGSRRSAATGEAKPTSTSAGKGGGRATKQARSGAAKTRTTARSGAAKSTGSARGQKAGATGKRATTKNTAASSDAGNESRDVVMLTRGHIQETLDDAASRGRVTRKDANELVSELVRRGRAYSDDLRSDAEGLLDKGREKLGYATRRARKEPLDLLVRSADRARRVAGVGSSFPILGYDDLNASQVQARIKELSRPELRKVLNYERKHADRKTVVGALDKALNQS